MIDLRVLLVINGLNNGAGTERVCSMIANGLSEAGHEIVLGSIEPSDKPFFPLNKNIKIVDFPRPNLGRLSVSAYKIKNFWNTIYRIRNKLYDTPSTAYRIRKLIKKEQIDTVIAVDILRMQVVLPAIIGLRINLIAWEHFNFNVNQWGNIAKMRQRAARYCDAVVTLTERDKECWLRGTNHKSQIITIANPCPFPVQEYVKKNTKTVLAVGRLTHEKGYDMLLEAWVQVTKVMPDWRLKIVGEGRARDTLTEFIKKNHLTDSVELVGNTDDVGQYYQQAEILCLSSRFEGFGMVLIEALAFGLPIVSFDCDFGPVEILEDTGSILVAQNDILQLSASLIALMSNEQQRRTIGLRGKEKAEIYQPKNIINQWIALLESFE